MHTENTIIIRGSRQRIFDLAAAVENWPLILPHYKEVRILEQTPNGLRKIVKMSAWRDDFLLPGLRFPVTWRSVQLCEPDAGLISFKHLAGMAMGMWVVWKLEPATDMGTVKVSIQHDLRYPWTALNGVFAEELVGRQFVSAIAGRTLATIKQIVESEGSR